MTGTDWMQWHEAYERADSGLRARLSTVRDVIDRYLTSTAPQPVRVVSACAGDGRDLLGVLAARTDVDRVCGLLIERDTELVARARETAASMRARIDVQQADAAQSDHYRGAVPADLVLLCGTFGNVCAADVSATIEVAPQLLCSRRSGDLDSPSGFPRPTPSIRKGFEQAGFEEVAFIAPQDALGLWSVGVHRLIADPQPLRAGSHWFTFFK